MSTDLSRSNNNGNNLLTRDIPVLNKLSSNVRSNPWNAARECHKKVLAVQYAGCIMYRSDLFLRGLLFSILLLPLLLPSLWRLMLGPSHTASRPRATRFLSRRNAPLISRHSPRPPGVLLLLLLALGRLPRQSRTTTAALCPAPTARCPALCRRPVGANIAPLSRSDGSAVSSLRTSRWETWRGK